MRTAPSGSASEPVRARRSASQSATAVSSTCGRSRSRSLSRSARSRVPGSSMQVAGQLGQHRVERRPGPVPRVVADVGHPPHQLEVDARDDPLVDALGRPPRRPLAEHVRDGVRVVHQPPVQLVEHQVDEAVVQVVAHRLGEQVAQQRRDRLLAEPREERVLDEAAHVLVAHLVQPGGHDLGGLVDHAARVLRHRAARRPTRAATWAAPIRSRTTSSCRKFSPTNSCRPRPRSSLRRGISAVCGIGSPSGCRNSAVTANQSAIAPTIEASAPALTNPQNPSASRVRA